MGSKGGWKARRRRTRPLRGESLESRLLLANDLAFNNPGQPLDVNRDLRVSPIDALQVINFIARNGVDFELPSDNTGTNFPDVDRSDSVSPIDALNVINALGRLQTGVSVIPAARLAYDSGPSGQANLDFITNEYSLEFGVTGGNASEQLELRVDHSADEPFVVVGNISESGQVSLSESDLGQLLGTTLSDGDHQVEFRLSGSDQALSFVVTIDKQAPLPATFALDAVSRAESSNGAVTTLDIVAIEGMTQPGASVTLAPVGLQIIADGDGNFSSQDLAINDGLNPFSSRVEDLAGNVSEFKLSIAKVSPSPTSLDDSFVLRESGKWLAERVFPIDLGQVDGNRRLSFAIDAMFDESDSDVLIGDLFQLYLVDPTNPGTTLLDRGVEGEAIFSLGETGANFLPGLVSFDGFRVNVDLTALADQSQGILVMQLINGDADDGTEITISQFENLSDPDGSQSPVFSRNPLRAVPGQAIDVGALTPVSDTSVQVNAKNIRVDGEAGRYLADLTVRNIAAPMSRTLAIRINDLPEGVTVINASGQSADGTPYLNLAPAIANGGLDSGAESVPIELQISNPQFLKFELVVDVLSAGPNRVPVFDPLAEITILPGETIDVDFNAVDPDGDRVSYSLDFEGALPSMIFRGNGSLEIFPLPGQEGSYTFDVIASDGLSRSRQPMTLHVVADTNRTTRISGSVHDVGGTPLVGVPVSLSRMTVMTDSEGKFTIELPSFLIPTEDFQIEVPIGDVYFDPLSSGDKTIDFRWARYDTSTGTSEANPRRHPNLVTSFLDASVVYGSDIERAQALRTLDGTGKLKTSDGELLPLNNLQYFPGGPLENDAAGTSQPTNMFVAGDVRSSENPALSSLHTILLREHNRLATEIALAEPFLSGDEIYERARHFVAGLIQHITYNEYLPLLVGTNALSSYTGYNPDVQPGIGAMFTTAAFRIGHSQATPETSRTDDSGVPLDPITTREGFFNTSFILSDGIDSILRGVATQVAQEVDSKVIDELRNSLFGAPGSGGLDLAAIGIQRGRDLGLPSYNQARVSLGLPAVTSFSQISSSASVQYQLMTTYGTIDKIDVFVGGLAEDHVAGAQVGELFRTAIARQFELTRDSDRFWFENGQFTSTELAQIRATTLASLIQRNSGITDLPANVFTTQTAPTGPSPGGTAALAMVTEHRSIDGAGNNESNSVWGQTKSNLLIDTTLNYADGISAPNGGDRPNARVISNGVLAQSESVPSAAGVTTMFVFWGQLLAHDLSLTPTGTSDVLKIHGSEASVPGKTYPFVAEKLDLLLDHPTFEEINNVIDRPIYLPALDVAGGTLVDPNQYMFIQQEIAPGDFVAIEFAPGTMMDQQGNPFTGTLSITEVPGEFTPAALPPGMLPEVVVTIQPSEMLFTTPAPITFPNRAGWPSGTQMDLWSINPVTGVFDDVGDMVVSGDQIVTVRGGVRNSSWHFPLISTVGGGNNQNNECEECEEGESGGSEVLGHSGVLLETHDLPSYQSLGQVRNVTLSYDSLRADPRPIVHLRMVDQGWSLTHVLGRIMVDMGSVGVQVPGVSGTSVFDTGMNIFAATDDNAMEFALQLDLHDLPTGIVSYTAEVAARIIRDDFEAGDSATFQDELLNVNSIGSPFGNGWGIAGLLQIVEASDGSILVVDGDGSEQRYRPPNKPGSPYKSPPGNYSVMERLGDGTFRETTTEKSVYQYDGQNRISS
ncbi:MAG: hypothetical protein KDB00_16590, partial [Planctomycetales bacterium]|nr:hypothetical protein [Planctomycetales bacterium]